MNPYRAFLYTIFFISMFNGCSSISTLVKFKPDFEGIHPHLKWAVDEVKELSKGCLGVTEHIGFFKKVPRSYRGGTVVGMASWILPTMKPQVSINDKYWYRVHKKQQILLMAHELYHAEKPYLGHIEKFDEWGCAEHFMSPDTQGYWCDHYNFDKYVKQMQDCK